MMDYCMATEMETAPIPREVRHYYKDRIRRRIMNVRYCAKTGRLHAPADEEVALYTRFFMIAYGVISLDEVEDVLNPVDPASIICTCRCCVPANNMHPVVTKPIIAYAHEVPPTPVDKSYVEWRDPRPAPNAVWSTSTIYHGEFLMKWREANEYMAKASCYEVYGYRDLLPEGYNKNPWKRLSIDNRRKFLVDDLEHGGFYHYTVRSIDEYGRRSPFSKPISLLLTVS